MKFLVVSDSHGDRAILEDLVSEWEGKVEKMFHNGDSELLSSDSIWEHFTVVGGNMDFDSGYKDVQVTKLGNDTIFQTHGHLQGINFSFQKLQYQAEEASATIVLYGHLHRISAEMHQGMLFVNPGSISQPRGEINEKAYAILEANEEKITVQYFRRDHTPIDYLKFIFPRGN